MKKIQILAGCLGVLLYTSACNSGSEKKEAKVIQASAEPKKVVEVTLDSKEFVDKATKSGMMEVDMGKLAVKNAKDKEVKSFAQMMVDDHTKGNAELKKIATSKNITVPTSMGNDNMMMMTELKKKTGSEFDKAYIQEMVKGHKELMDYFEKASKELKDPELKNYATTTVKTIKTHYDKATAIETKLNASSSTKMNGGSMNNSKMNESGNMKSGSMKSN